MAADQKYQSSDKDKVPGISLRMDELLAQLGNPGRYQVIIITLICLNYFPLVFNHIIMAFFGAKTPHSCDPLHGRDSYAMGGTNLTVVARTAEQCKMHISLETGVNKTLNCAGGDWVYKTDDRETNIVTEWDLVCDSASLRPLATTIYFCGVMIGGLIFGHLSDKFGRRPIMLVTLYVPIALGVGIYFVPSYVGFVIIRFVEGVFLQGLQISSYVLVAEMFLPKYRPLAGGVVECFWGASVMALAGVVYFIRDWRYIQLAICLPTLLALFYICVIPESLRWMIMSGKLDAAEKLVEKMCRCNKLTFPRESWMAVRAVAEGRREVHNKQYSLLDLLKTPRLRKRSLILFFLWFAVSAGYYGMTLKITSLAGNKYLNFFIGACVEMLAYILDIYIMMRHKRRVAVICLALLGAVTLIIAGALPAQTTASGVDLKLVSTGFAIVGRFAVAALFSLYFMYTSEQYPTVIRNIGMGGCMFWTRLGGVLAPQINSLGSLTYEPVPVIVFGVMMLISALLAVMLTETHKKKLPDTIDDVEGEMADSETQIVQTEKDLLHQQQNNSDFTTRL